MSDNFDQFNPQTAEEFCQRGVARMESQSWKDAIDDFTEAIKLKPDVAAGYRLRAIAFVEHGSVPRAIADLDMAVRLKPDDVDALYDRAQFFLRQKQYSEAIADCNRAISLDEGRGDLFALRGRVHESRGACELADLDFSKAIQLNPEGEFQYRVWRGDVRMKKDDVIDAVDDYTQAIAIRPDETYPWMRRATANWLLGQYQQALNDFSTGIEKDPESVKLHNGRGLVYQSMKDYSSALADFQISYRLQPENGSTQEYLAECYWHLGQHAEAFQAIDRAIEIHGNSAHLFNIRATFHYYMHDYAKAVRDHTAALKCDPNSAVTFNYLGWIWSTVPDRVFRNGRRAVECATRACELTEFLTATYLDTLAAANAEIGNFVEAEKWAERAVELAEKPEERTLYKQHADLFFERHPLRVTPEFHS
ncbi:MAG: tetratricopeptide repeat protein [Zavarzinella sp.]